MQGRNGSYNICSQVEGARKFYKCAIKSITKTSLDSSNKKFPCAVNIKSQHNTRSDAQDFERLIPEAREAIHVKTMHHWI